MPPMLRPIRLHRMPTLIHSQHQLAFNGLMHSMLAGLLALRDLLEYSVLDLP